MKINLWIKRNMILEHIPDNWTIQKRGRRVYLYDENGKPRCGKRLTRNHKPCMNPPAKAHCRCNLHGAKNKSGQEHGAYKDGKHIGRYSVPDAFINRYEAMQNDPAILDLRNNIGLIDSRLQILLDKIGDEDLGQAVLPQISRLYYRAERFLRDRNMEEFVSLWLEMGRLINAGQKDYLIWQELIKVNEQRGKMTKQAVDIELAAHKAVSISEMMFYMRQIYLAFQTSNQLINADERERAFTLAIKQMLSEEIKE